MIYGRVMLCNDLLMSTNISWNVDHFIRADKYLNIGGVQRLKQDFLETYYLTLIHVAVVGVNPLDLPVE